VTVRVGQPFTVSLDPSLKRRDAMNAASDQIMRAIAALTDERHRGRYSTEPSSGGPENAEPATV
jgi:hypothetical protein